MRKCRYWVCCCFNITEARGSSIPGLLSSSAAVYSGSCSAAHQLPDLEIPLSFPISFTLKGGGL